MGNRKTPLKKRNMMYVQQIEHLPNGNSITQLEEAIKNLSGIKKYALIVHNKDINMETGALSKPHVHVMLQFENKRSLAQVAKELGDEPQTIQKWDERVENGFSYLIHATDSARHLHQYSADDVIANFDYIGFIDKKISQQNKTYKSSASKPLDNIINAVASGSVSLKNAKKLLSGKEYARIRKDLESANSLFLERSAISFHDQMKKSNETVYVIWIYGETGTGKTRLARKFAEDKGSYYKTTATNDPFQFYQAEPTIILDELRPKTIPYSELLAMLDPFSYGEVVMSSRYYNKALACNLFIITTPFNPVQFYEAYGLDDIDNGHQFYRRLSEVWKMVHPFIYKMEYSTEKNIYNPCAIIPNEFSKKDDSTIEEKDYFSMISEISK